MIPGRKTEDLKDPDGVSVGDILQGIYSYLNTRLTREEIKELSQEELISMKSYSSKRWRLVHSPSEAAPATHPQESPLRG